MSLAFPDYNRLFAVSSSGFVAPAMLVERIVPGYSGGGRAGLSPASLDTTPLSTALYIARMKRQVARRTGPL